MRESLMVAYQLIYPLTQGEKVDELWLDAARDWCDLTHSPEPPQGEAGA